ARHGPLLSTNTQALRGWQVTTLQIQQSVDGRGTRRVVAVDTAQRDPVDRGVPGQGRYAHRVPIAAGVAHHRRVAGPVQDLARAAHREHHHAIRVAEVHTVDGDRVVGEALDGQHLPVVPPDDPGPGLAVDVAADKCLDVVERRSEEHTSELQSRENLVCRLL